MCDIIGYSRSIQDGEGRTSTKLFMRGTPRYVAGSRFRYTPDVIDFTYDNLVNAIADAIDKEAATRGAGAVTNAAAQMHVDEPSYDFPALMDEFQTIVGQLMQKGSPTNAAKITQIVESHLGRGKKVGDCTADQAAQLDMIIFDLKRL
jgi:hypothetical protein